jgi:hypothetical protein
MRFFGLIEALPVCVTEKTLIPLEFVASTH